MRCRVYKFPVFESALNQLLHLHPAILAMILKCVIKSLMLPLHTCTVRLIDLVNYCKAFPLCD